MTHRVVPAIVLPLLAAAMSVPAAAALEIAPDGRPARVIAGVQATPRGDADLPFAATPDWQNTIRIQVGGLAFGDLDHDGRPDLAAVAYQSNSFPPYDDWRNFVYFNTGSTLQAEAGWISADEVHSGDAAVGDVNRDGFNDLVVANGGSAYSPNVIYFGSATGLATSPGWQSAAPAWAVGMALVDIDGDGDLDLATANQGRGSGDNFRPPYLFRNVAGALATTPDWASGEPAIQNSVAAGDVDGDGDVDLGFARWVNFASGFYLNQGNGAFGTAPSPQFGTGAGDRGIELADMDGDGDLDLVLGVGDFVKIFRNDGGGTWMDVWTSAQAANHQDLLVADFDADGRPDIVDIDFSSGRTHLYLNRGVLPATTPDWTYDAPGSGTALAAADVDGDGMLDLAIGYSGTPSAVLFLNRLKREDAIFADGFDLPPQPECAWNTAPGNPGGSLNTIGRWNNELYLGGTFAGVTAGVARMDLASGVVSALGTTQTTDGFIGAFVPFDAGAGERLFVLGTFNGVRFGGADLADSRGIFAWDGATSTSVPGSPYAQPLHFAQTGMRWGNRLVVAGAGGFEPQRALLTLWDGATWTTWRDEFEGTVAPVIFAVEQFAGDLYFAGRFDRIRVPDGNGGQVVTESRNVMSFDGSAFVSVGGGVIRLNSVQGFGMALKTFDDGHGEALYIGGSFNSSASGGIALPGVARWDGTTLAPVGQGFPISQVRSLEVHDDGSGPALFAAGTFATDAQGAPVRRLAKLVGSTWIEVAGGTGSNPSRLAVLPDGGLAVAGSFTEVGAAGVPGSGTSNGLAVLGCMMPPAR
ncbi:MAG: VCBS repeat-containing protein [Xanthomonadales bacterium]|nr:VCBS repeat-containing protein [Xanthomonadales bacterium]